MASRIAQTVEQWGRAVVQQYIERPLLVRERRGVGTAEALLHRPSETIRKGGLK